MRHIVHETFSLDGRTPDEIREIFRGGQERLERAGKRLAQLGWVTPMSLSPAETYEILDAKTPEAIDQRFIELYEADRRRYFNDTLREMLARNQ